MRPRVSIIVATFSRPHQLARCLSALSLLDYPTDSFEVIVVDDGSPMPLDHALKSFASDAPIRLIRQSNAGPAAARNRGAMDAQGEYLAITDDDCIPNKDWLSKFADCALRSPDHGFGGHIGNLLTSNVYSTSSQLLIDYLYEYYQPGKEGRFFASNNIFLPAKHFKAIGGFDSSFPNAAAEDRDFCARWIAAGFELTYCADAIVMHAHQMNLAAYVRQHFLYGRGAYHYHLNRAKRGGGKIKIEPASFYLNLLKYPHGRAASINPNIATSLLFLSQVANASGFFYEKFGNQFNPGRHTSLFAHLL